MARETILLVDDQPMTINLVQSVLISEGYQVLVAGNATEALLAVRDSKPDLILMDIHLPGLDGLALTKLLKSNAESRHIKIVAISADASVQDDARMGSSGCDGFIPKPIDTRTLPASIKEYLDSFSPQI
ncbi:MAG TPA: response regulator [Candidatus Binatus sp.]|nr:response regulator [Candidatus Binatus sp.]